MSNPHASVPREETPIAPSQPMQTQSTKKKFRVEFHYKWNEERNKPSGKTPEDPVIQMNPPGSVELPPKYLEDFGEDENIAL